MSNLLNGFLDFNVPLLTWEEFYLIQPNVYPAFITPLWGGGQLSVEAVNGLYHGLTDSNGCWLDGFLDFNVPLLT